MVAQALVEFALEQGKARIGHGLDLVFRFGRQQADALAAGKFGEQAEPFSGAAANSEARIRLTAEAASCAVSRARGSASM
jgi:hypothetical protein